MKSVRKELKSFKRLYFLFQFLALKTKNDVLLT